MPQQLPLEPSEQQMRDIGSTALDYVIDFLQARETAPATHHERAFEVAAELREAPKETGRSFSEALGIIDKGVRNAYDPTGPGYLAYVPGGGLFASAIADLIADVTNRFINLAAPAPGLVQLEANVCRWLCDLFELPPGAQGILTSGGSMANFSAIVTARTSKLGDDLRGATFYSSEHLHHSSMKAAKLAGLPLSAFREVPCDDQLRMDVDSLRRLVQLDRAEGKRPFLVIGSAGTVNTGAVDPLREIAGLSRDLGLWFHVDAAYGGFFQLTDEGRTTLDGISEADSITLDPHKGLFLPYGTGSLLVRDGKELLAAHQVEAKYLPHASLDSEVPDFADLSPELSRDFRGLRVWLPLFIHGVGAFREALTEKLELARVVHAELSEIDQLVIPWTPQLSIVAFRQRQGGNEAAEAMLQKINESKRVFLSATQLDGDTYLRVCVLSHRTHRARIDEAIEIIRKVATDL